LITVKQILDKTAIGLHYLISNTAGDNKSVWQAISTSISTIKKKGKAIPVTGRART
jgi:hypothetical protein